MTETAEQRAMRAATQAALKIITASKDKRTILGRMKPSSVAFHAAWAAIDAYHREKERHEPGPR